MNSWRNLVPAPLAAPETRTLKAARLRTMTGLFLVAALVVSFGALRALTGIFALALFAGATTFALLPMDRLLSPNGPLVRLEAEGYAVQQPDEADP